MSLISRVQARRKQPKQDMFGVDGKETHPDCVSVSKLREDEGEDEGEGGRETLLSVAPTPTTNGSGRAWARPDRTGPGPPAHASHFMNSISTGRNSQFDRAIITARGGSANCFCSIMHSDAIIFLSNYRGVSAACHPGADFQFN